MDYVVAHYTCKQYGNYDLVYDLYAPACMLTTRKHWLLSMRCPGNWHAVCVRDSRSHPTCPRPIILSRSIPANQRFRSDWQIEPRQSGNGDATECLDHWPNECLPVFVILLAQWILLTHGNAALEARTHAVILARLLANR